MSGPAALERRAKRADYEAFLMILDEIKPGAYFSIEDIRDAVDALQLSPNAIGLLFSRASRDGHLTGTDRVLTCKPSSRRGGTAHVWRKATPRSAR